MTTQQSAPTADQHQLNSSAVPAQPSNSICITSSTSSTLLGRASIPQGHIDTHSVNQRLHKPEHRSHSLCNLHLQYLVLERPHCSNEHQHLKPTLTHTQLTEDCHQWIHIIHYLQPNHTATPTIYTKHKDYPHLLDALSPQINRQHILVLRQSHEIY